MAIKFNQIGKTNMALLLALKNGESHAAGYHVSEYLHEKSYNYDLSYGLHGIWNKRSLPGKYVGTKYYCYKGDTIDMKKRLVHIHDPQNPENPESFYILVHTGGDPRLRDNSYGSCDLVTDIP